MKENKLIKSATDRQMPDFEKIRENVLNQTSQKQKPKIIAFKPSRLISVAVILALAVIGTVVAVANHNGMLFAANPEEIITAPVILTESTTPSTVKKPQKTNGNNSNASQKGNKISERKKNIKRLKKSGISVDWLYKLGKVEGYTICYAGNKNSSDYECDYIMGDYTFTAETQQYPYGLGIYVCSKKASYTLADAYKAGIFDNFSAVASIIEDYDKRDIGIEVLEKNPNSENFRDYFEGLDIITLAKLNTDDYDLYFKIASTYTNTQYEKEFDDYTFYVNMVQKPYELGLYVVYDEKILTLEEALDEYGLDMEEVFDAVHEDSSIPYNWGLFKNEKVETEPTTAPIEDETLDEE
ncbi:MAG: hypothetical protein J1E41_04840 [Ruminococcus sp.]|nr:hypothetical protein [Ruminococcus sp.]